MIDFWASHSHLADHLLPVWLALPPETRGTFSVPHELISYLAQRGVMGDTNVPTRGQVMVMARGRDLKRDKHDVRVLLEHGVGQTYSGAHNDSYSDGERPWIDLHLVPSERVAQMSGENAVVVGCPKMDRFHALSAPRLPPGGMRPPNPCVAFTWHWDGSAVAPEAGTAFYEYRDALAALAATPDRGYDIIGHAHPRIQHEAFPWYERAGIRVARTLDEVFNSAHVLVCDNSSAMFEFASLDRPVVVVNASTYRKDVSHGGRFWEWAGVGVQVDQPDMLDFAIHETLKRGTTSCEARRREIVRECYGYLDGHCAERAAAAILEHVGAHVDA